jgi:hypothetical protein
MPNRDLDLSLSHAITLALFYMGVHPYSDAAGYFPSNHSIAALRTTPRTWDRHWFSDGVVAGMDHSSTLTRVDNYSLVQAVALPNFAPKADTSDVFPVLGGP